MPKATVGTNLHQSLDVESHQATEVSLYPTRQLLGNHITEAADLDLG